jgi:hypothetical protein
MMKNYEEELKLFKKMKKVWESNQLKCEESDEKRGVKSKSKSK